jgi:hypothetical protein
VAKVPKIAGGDGDHDASIAHKSRLVIRKIGGIDLFSLRAWRDAVPLLQNRTHFDQQMGELA